ncbi:phytoene desaturase family protein [Thermodesulfobacteriota bacterium]
MTEQYDAIIIGSGIGGVAIGALLAHAGQRVLILERLKEVGGRCTSYEQKGFTLDLGTHLFGVGNNGHLGEVFRQLDTPDALEWITITNATMQIGDKVMPYSMKTMMDVLPEGESENIQNIFKAALEMPDQELEGLWYVPLDEWAGRFTKHPLGLTLIESISTQYFGVNMAETSTGEFIQCFQEVVKSRSSAYPKGGCIAIPKAFIDIFKKHGGELITKAKVEKITVENGAAKGVKVKEGSSYFAPVIISGADIKHTVADLVGEEHFPAEYAQRIEELTWSSSVLSLKVALNEKITDDQLVMYMPTDFYPVLKVPQEMKADDVPELVGGMIVSPSNYDPDLAPPGHQLISFCTACPPHHDWKKWEEALLDSFYAIYPQAKGKVLWHRLDTPEFINSIAMEDGTCVGVGQTVDQIHERRPSVVSPLKGLYFSSAEVSGHGIGTELAANAAQELLAVLVPDK